MRSGLLNIVMNGATTRQTVAMQTGN